MIAFDLESVPLAAALDVPYPMDRQPPGTMSKPETIAAWRANDELAWQAGRVKECSLNPRLGRVVAIGYGGALGPWVEVARTEDEERKMLSLFWLAVREHGQIAGWNSIGFDLPFLVVRSALLDVPVGVNVANYLKRYSTTPHLDCKMALLNWPSGYAKGEGLDEWATAFGIPGKTGHGGDVAGMVERGEWDQLTAYTEQDARCTYAIASRIAPFFGVMP